MKQVNKREFQRYFHKHTQDISEPIMITNHGKPEFYVMSANVNLSDASLNLTLNSSGKITRAEVVQNDQEEHSC